MFGITGQIHTKLPDHVGPPTEYHTFTIKSARMGKTNGYGDERLAANYRRRDFAVPTTAVTDRSEFVVAPAIGCVRFRHSTGQAESLSCWSARSRIAASRDRSKPVVARNSSRRRGTRHRVASFLWVPYAKLASSPTSPAIRLAFGSDRTCVKRSDGDRVEPQARGDGNRSRPVYRRPVAYLAVIVPAPAVCFAARGKTTTMIGAVPHDLERRRIDCDRYGNRPTNAWKGPAVRCHILPNPAKPICRPPTPCSPIDHQREGRMRPSDDCAHERQTWCPPVHQPQTVHANHGGVLGFPRDGHTLYTFVVLVIRHRDQPKRIAHQDDRAGGHDLDPGRPRSRALDLPAADPCRNHGQQANWPTNAHAWRRSARSLPIGPRSHRYWLKRFFFHALRILDRLQSPGSEADSEYAVEAGFL